jgi:hypothetical protein
MTFFSKPLNKQVTAPIEPIPVGVVVESDWAAWADSVGFQDSEPSDFQMTDKLPITPEEGESIDVFASVTRKGK